MDADGEVLESKKVCLSVTEKVLSGDLDFTGEHAFKLFDKITFTIDEDKPLLGNQEFEIDLGLISNEIEIDAEEGTFKAVLGVQFEKDEDGKFGAAEFINLKEDIKKWKENIKEAKVNAKEFYKSGKKGTAFKIKSGWEPKAAVCGYIEGCVEDGQLIPTEGGIVGNAELKYTYKGQAYIVVVPVYYSIGAGGSVELSAGVKGLIPGEGMQPIFTGDLKIVPKFEIRGGVGVVYLGEVGAKGKATLTVHVALERDYQKVDLKGQAYFEITALSLQLYEREFAKGTWNIYETGRNEGKANLQSVSEDIYASIDIHTPIVPEDRSYVSRSTRWIGDTPQISLMDTDYTNKELRILQTNAYPSARPQIMDVNGTKVMVWVADNLEREAANKSMLVYSVYSDAEDIWLEPVAILDDGCGDYYPIAKDGYVVWQKANEEFDTSATLAEVAQSMEIYVSRFNGIAFEAPTRLTKNEVMDAQPHIAVNGAELAVVWTKNTENHIFGMDGENSIHQMTYDGSAWSIEEVLEDGLNVVAHLDTGYMNGEPVTAYVLDEDNDLNSIDDREIYIIRDGVTEQFTDNAVLDSNPVFERINGIPALFWYNNANVHYVTDLDEQVLNTVSVDGIEQLTDDYAMLSNGNHTAVLWTNLEDGVSEVHGAIYDGSQWSHDVEITQTGESARYPDGLIEDNGELLIGFNRIKNVEDGEYYKDGQADLCVINVTPSYDIAVESAFMMDRVTPNAEVPVYITVKNTGEMAVSDLSVEVLDVDGTRNGVFTFEEILQPGESVELEVSYDAGSSIKSGNIRVKIDTESGSEYDTENNQASIAIGQSDIAITDVSVAEEADTRMITVNLENLGYTDAETVKAQILREDAVIAEETFDSVDAQEMQEVVFTVDANTFTAAEELIVLTASVSSETEDGSLGNNTQGFAITKGSGSQTPVCTIAEIASHNNGVDVKIENGVNRDAKLFIAVYAEDGKMLHVREKDVTAADMAAGWIGVVIDTEEAAAVSAFLLEADGSMQPITIKKSKIF